MFASQEMLGMAGSCQHWERGREQILAQSSKKRTTCHHREARLPEDCEQVGVGLPEVTQLGRPSQRLSRSGKGPKVSTLWEAKAFCFCPCQML